MVGSTSVSTRAVLHIEPAISAVIMVLGCQFCGLVARQFPWVGRSSSINSESCQCSQPPRFGTRVPLPSLATLPGSERHNSGASLIMTLHRN